MTEPLPVDKIFIQKLTEIIQSNLNNENFGVKELAHESGMSLYRMGRKLHSVNKKTVNQFIREIRLQKALEMLQNEQYTVADVAYKTGFGSATYFNKCFHKFFGYSPGKVRKNVLKGTEESILNQVLTKQAQSKPPRWTLKVSLYGILFLTGLILAISFIVNPKMFKKGTLQKLQSSGERVSIAVMPFQNMISDTAWNVWRDAIQQGLISSLSNTGELRVRQKEYINTLLQTRGHADYARISPAVAGTISKKLDADIFINGSIQLAGSAIRVDAQLIDTKTKEVFKSFNIERPSEDNNIFQIIDTLSTEVRNFLLISKLIKENPAYGLIPTTTNSPDAFKYFIYGRQAFHKGDFLAAKDWYSKALTVDSNYFYPMLGLSDVFASQGMVEPDLQWVLKYYKKKDRWPTVEQLWASWAYAFSFEAPEEGIKYLRQLLQIDDQEPKALYLLGYTYNGIGQYDKAIPVLEKSLEIQHKWGKEYLKGSWAFPNLGYAYHKTGLYKKEKKLYKKAEKYFNDNPNIWDMQAILSLTEKDTIEANRYIEKYVSIRKKNSSSEADITTGLAWIYSEACIPDKAEKFYRKAISLEPGNPSPLKEFANFLIDKNRNLTEVSDLMDRAMKLAHNKYDFYEYSDIRGWGLYKQGQYQEALEILQKTWDSAQFKMYFIFSHLKEVKKAFAEQK